MKFEILKYVDQPIFQNKSFSKMRHTIFHGIRRVMARIGAAGVFKICHWGKSGAKSKCRHFSETPLLSGVSVLPPLMTLSLLSWTLPENRRKVATFFLEVPSFASLSHHKIPILHIFGHNFFLHI